MAADVMIDMSAGAAWFGVGVGIDVVTVGVIIFGFIIKSVCTGKKLAGVRSSAISGGAPSIGPEVNGSDSTAVMTAVEFAMRAPWEDALLRC